MTHVTCRLTAKNRDQLRNPTLGNRVWATFFTLPVMRPEALCFRLVRPSVCAYVRACVCRRCPQWRNYRNSGALDKYPSRALPPLSLPSPLTISPPSRPSIPLRQTHFCAIHSPKYANLLKVSPTCTRLPYNINSCEDFFAWNSGAPGLCPPPAHPIATPCTGCPGDDILPLGLLVASVTLNTDFCEFRASPTVKM